MANESPSSASTAQEAAAEHGTPTQRAAGAARLRRLARSQPRHGEALARLADILTSDPDKPQEETAAAGGS